MNIRWLALCAGAAGVLVSGCKDQTQTPIPHTPTSIVVVSGANQSGNLSSPLDSSLIVQVKDAAGLSVAGVALVWTAAGGGTVSPASTTTDTSGRSSATWTLAPTTGLQVVTVTSPAIAGASVAFVANNGAVISGTVTSVWGSPFSPTASRVPATSRSSRSVMPQRSAAQLTTNRIIVGFKSDRLGVAPSGAISYRSMAVARQTATLMQRRIAALASAPRLSHAEISPAILAARLQVNDTTQIESVMASLRSDPNVAWVERDQIMTINDGSWRAVPAGLVSPMAGLPSGVSPSVVGTIPNDPGYFWESWAANMLDLPRAWSITTGSSSALVAVVDAGIRFDDPEVAPNYTRDGYDFVSQIPIAPDSSAQPICGGGSIVSVDGDGDGPDPDPTDPDELTFNGTCWAHSPSGDHGLFTSGILGSVGNDGLGIAGVIWNVKIRPVRVLGVTRQGTYFDITQGILYAAGLPAPGAGGAMVQAPTGARIINVSLGGPSFSSALSDAVAAAVNAGSLIIAAAGDYGVSNDIYPTYPAALPGVMAVAAVGMDGVLATYSNAGTGISVAAPGGDSRLDENWGGSVLAPGWNFQRGAPILTYGYGTDASAAYVSGVAALLLATNPSLTAAQLRSRIEQFATRSPGSARSDLYGWGIVNAYNALTQQNGPPRQTYVRLVNATTGAVTATTKAADGGRFAFTRVAQGAYYLQAGEDESGDATIGVPGRRFNWAGGFGAPTVFNVNANALSAAIGIGIPTEVEPNDDPAHANLLSVGSYVAGTITPPDTHDMYRVIIATPGTYTFETSGVVGACGMGIEVGTFLSVTTAAGDTVGSNENFLSATAQRCSRVQVSLAPGAYYVTVSVPPTALYDTHGRYRLEVRAGK